MGQISRRKVRLVSFTENGEIIWGLDGGRKGLTFGRNDFTTKARRALRIQWLFAITNEIRI